MREILFRGKAVNLHNRSKDFVYGQYVQNRDGKMIYSDTWENGKQKHYVIEETIGQYTGLTDKNGTKIFEGDIVKTDKFNTPNKHYVITYDLLLGAFIGEDDGTMYFTTFDGDSELFEVIGNIYDNPKLLKGGER